MLEVLHHIFGGLGGILTRAFKEKMRKCMIGLKRCGIGEDDGATQKNVSGHNFFDNMMCCMEKGPGGNFQRR